MHRNESRKPNRKRQSKEERPPFRKLANVIRKQHGKKCQAAYSLKIAHEFLAKSGGHTLVYWRSSVKNHIEFFNEFFRKPAIVETPGE